ncbi:MAG: TPM domain-containing protein, partial [Burkholderiales bacterium]|nr:TPM domain-containing protein [Burkholderiales bacterium]
RRMTARERALEVFGALRVWDTEANNGVLLYVLLADKAVEIIADRGAARAIAQPVWDEIARDLSKAFAGGTAREGCLAAVARLDALLADAFALDPRAGAARNPDELPDRPAVL